MDTGMLHLHVTIVSLFLLFFLFKTILLVLGKKDLLEKIRTKTKVIEMIFGVLILVTGAYLIFILGNIATYLMVKIILVLVAVPLGIIGLKRENKLIAVLALLIFIYIYGVAETNSLTFKPQKFDMSAYNLKGIEGNESGDILDANVDAALQQGKVIYKVLCVECHGEDGTKALFNAANLKESQLSLEEKVEIITHGKGVMKGYDAELSEQEITLVAAYTETLK